MSGHEERPRAENGAAPDWGRSLERSMRAKAWLVGAGWKGEGLLRGETRSEAASRLATVFGKAQRDSGGELFACMAAMDVEISNWFYGWPWIAVGALRAGFDPLCMEDSSPGARERDDWQRRSYMGGSTFDRLAAHIPERREIIEAGIALGWNPDEPGRYKLGHPIATCIRHWINGEQSGSDSLAAIAAMLRGGSVFGLSQALAVVDDQSRSMPAVAHDVKAELGGLFQSVKEADELSRALPERASRDRKASSL